MIYYKNNQYNISEYKIHYIDEIEGEVIKYVGQEGKAYWEEFSEKWKDTFELVGFIEVVPSQAQLDRLDIINELIQVEGVSLVDEYVEFGDLSEVKRGHPLYTLVLESRLEDIELMTLGSGGVI